jgi:phytoene synthase
MNYEGDRAQKYFEDADKSLKFEDKSTMFAARAMQHIYHKLLLRLKDNNYDVYSNDINVTKFEKLFIALGVWSKYRLIY